MQKYLSRINFRQVIAVVLFVFFAYLMMDLNSRVMEYVNVSKERDKLSTEVLKLRMTQEVLQTEVAYATSEPAVEEWARGEGYLIRPGDVRVVPLVPVNATPTRQVVIVPTPRKVANWEVWYALFFGE